MKRVAYDLKTAKALLQKIVELLAKEAWFEEWKASVHYFPDDLNPESVTLHVYKSTWFNEDRKGIHFETALSESAWSSKTIQLMIHIFHTPTVPGTSIKRIAVSKPFIDETYDQISSWEGYKFRAGRYGTHPFTRTLKFEFENFDVTVSDELKKLCVNLGPVMDAILFRVLKR